MASHRDTTIDPKAIQTWVEARGGEPAEVGETEDSHHHGILRVDLGGDDAKLEVIEWNEFFARFDGHKLAFLHRNETADGKPGRFNKFVKRHGDR